jgi:uncharacterized repeat protein (TIGR03803 family)
MKTNWFIRQRSATGTFAALATLFVTVNLACAQPLQPEVLFSFNGTNGAGPVAALAQASDGNFYGTAWDGLYETGMTDGGTVFRVTTNGGLTNLYSFPLDDDVGDYYGYIFSAEPNGLTLGSDGSFYGTTRGDWNAGQLLSPPSDLGSIFRVTTDGVLTTLVSFDGSNGAFPFAGLTLGSDGNFYGTTSGDYFGPGTVFKVTTNGVLTTLVAFEGTNGANPYAGLTLGSDGNFYGTTYRGGDFDRGTVFKVMTNGVLTALASFNGINGRYPRAGLAPGSDGNFYGTTEYGGGKDYGTVFKVTTNGELTTLVSFDGTNGRWPEAALTLGRDGNFYGTTYFGGNSNKGTVFQVTTSGVLTTLVSFTGTNGAAPYAGLTLGSDGNFYGTTSRGGITNSSVPNGFGVIYRLRHQVSIQSFGMATNGFQLNTLNVGGSGWVVLESSSDLMTWTPIQTNGTAAGQQFLDPTALTQPRQFYRVRQQ